MDSGQEREGVVGARIRAFINPYQLKMHQFPGRLFPGFDTDSELAQLRQVLVGKRVFIELGSGSGGHLIEQAALQRDATFVGFELRFKRAFRTVEKATLQAIDNLLLARICASRFSEVVEGGSLAGIYINFPDPWEKKRQRKHRILSTDFLNRAFPLLAPGGTVSVKTDHKEYFAEFTGLIEADPRYRVIARTRDLHRSEFSSCNVETEFEKLFRGQKTPICHVAFSRANK